MAKRIQWIDFTRGIAILAVIIGHTLGPYTGQFFGSFIFAFHMPIFFILSGYLYHQRPIGKEFKHSAVNLLVPYATTATVILVINYAALKLPHNVVINPYFTSTKQGILAVIYGAGSEVFNPWGWRVAPIGAIWFLLSMFIALQFFNGLLVMTQRFKSAKAIQIGIILGLAVIGGVLGRLAYLPWAFNAALLSQVFLYAGYLIRQTNFLERVENAWYLVFIFAWLVSAFQGYFALTVPVSPNLVISVLGGIGASLAIIKGCIWLDRFQGRPSLNLLARYGRLSLIVLCFHLIDLDVIGIAGWLFNQTSPLFGNWLATVITILYRIGFVTFWMVVIPKIPIVRVGFFPRKYFLK